MDNLCHTLVGAAIGEGRARNATPLATATLLIGANLPDVDVLAYVAGPVDALGFRRGWTHGILAIVLWPFLLTGLMLLWDRAVRRRRRPDAAPARPRALLLLAALAVATHPVLDLMNTYGVRLLMPFSGRWFYGDAWFIVDPYVWLALLLGIMLARRARRRGATAPHRPARVALALVAVYGLFMAGTSAYFSRDIARSFVDRGLQGAGAVLSPNPGNPLRWTAIVTLADGYAVGRWDWTRRPRLRGPWVTIQSQAHLDWARAAAETPAGRTFLVWSRMPLYARGEAAGCRAGAVCIGDARYWPQDWASVAIPMAGPVSSRTANREVLP